MSMSSIPTIQASSSLLQPTKFQLQFGRLPNIVYFCQKITLPGGEVKPVEQSTPFKNRLRAGHKLEYDRLKISFLVDEQMYSWQGVHDWLSDIATETGFKDYNDLKKFPNQSLSTTQTAYPNAYCDATLSILDTQNNPKIRFIYKDCFPIKLGEIDMDTEKAATDVIHCNAVFGFFYYEIERISG